MVYGDFRSSTVSETDNTEPKEIYGSLKLAGEIMVRGYANAYGLDTAIVRPSAVYGPYDSNQRVLQKFVTRALKQLPLKIDGDGSSRLDFTYVDDAAQGIYKVATHPDGAGQTFNITRGESKSLREAVEIIQSELGNVSIEYGPPVGYMPDRGTLDITKAQTLVGYEPAYSLEEGLARYIEHLRHHDI
jgi:nucleoside-diphosphate-sugar epimerase